MLHRLMGYLLVYYVNKVIKLFFFINTACGIADPCMMFYKVIVYRIVNFI